MRLRAIIILALLLGVVAIVTISGLKHRSLLEAPGDAMADQSPAEPEAAFNEAIEALVASEADSPALSITPAATSNLFQRIASGEVEMHLTSAKIVEYLRRHGTNVETLLATGNRDCLRLAAELFPDDPRVQYAVITGDLFPESKREWLESFKQSAPDNSVANYLSAREYLRAGDRERGLQELTAAANKLHFNDYTLERWQNAEEALLSSGRSVVEAKIAAGISLQLPQLAVFKSLAQEMQAVQKEHLRAGDAASAETLARIGHGLAQQLSQGEGARPLINQLVGVAIDRIVLSPLPADSQPEFLARPIQQHIDALTDFRKNVRTLLPQFDAMLARGDAAEIISYFDRLKLQGEYKALEWLHRRHP